MVEACYDGHPLCPLLLANGGGGGDGTSGRWEIPSRLVGGTHRVQGKIWCDDVTWWDRGEETGEGGGEGRTIRGMTKQADYSGGPPPKGPRVVIDNRPGPQMWQMQ